MRESVYIKRLRVICEELRGNLIRLSEYAYDDISKSPAFSQAPFSKNRIGVHHAEEWIMYSSRVYWPELIHEMGHVFACSGDPFSSDEFEFFGWEYVVAKCVHGVDEWMKMHSNYYVTDDQITFGSLTAIGKTQVLDERVQRAIELGLLSKDLKPLSIR